MSKHTPGPWEAFKNRQQYVCFEGYPIAKALKYTYKKHKEFYVREWEANARLIAAAPDLLEACKLALDYWHRNDVSRCGDTYPALIEAINKAEGK